MEVEVGAFVAVGGNKVPHSCDVVDGAFLGGTHHPDKREDRNVLGNQVINCALECGKVHAI